MKKKKKKNSKETEGKRNTLQNTKDTDVTVELNCHHSI